MKTISPDDLIESLKQALIFYANGDNYEKNLFHEKGLIYSDHGEQAKFALSMIKDYENSDFELENTDESQLELFNKWENHPLLEGLVGLNTDEIFFKMYESKEKYVINDEEENND
jgi:hypothetical protein